MEDILEEPDNSEWVKRVERNEPEECFCAECGKILNRELAHVSIVMSEERKVGKDIIPFDVSAIAFYHLECSPYRRATRT